MAQKQTQKVKGCKKCGRTKKKEAGRGGVLSQFVRGKITASQYFQAIKQPFKAV